MTPEALSVALLCTPLVLFLGLGCVWLLGGRVSDGVMANVSRTVHLLLVGLVGALVWQYEQGPEVAVRAVLGHWFEVEDYSFPLTLLIDELSLPLVVVTVLLVGIVGAFSVRYLHRDSGFYRFFLLLHLFTFGALLVFMADSLDLLLAGWEMVGITSVLLIGFFQQRPDPVRNALRVFGTYRVADLFILLGVFLAHHWFHSASWSALFAAQAGGAAGSAGAVVAVLLVFAASGKSAQGPFCGWLARAMEGPTPSSAVFYGAISIHAGAYLLLRIQPLIQASWVATALVFLIGISTAFLGTLVHRTYADAKTSLAYAAQSQIGLIFVEISLGWTTLAQMHMLSHALLRTLQFLRAPSMLRDYNRVHAAAGGQLEPTGGQYEVLLPKAFQMALYRVALGRGFYDAALDRFVVAPTLAVARFLRFFEPCVPPAKEEETPARAPMRSTAI